MIALSKQWRCASSNLRSLREECADLLTGFIDFINVEIMVFQESHLYQLSNIDRLLKANQQLDFAFSHSNAVSRGVGIAYKRDCFDNASVLTINFKENKEFKFP